MSDILSLADTDIRYFMFADIRYLYRLNANRYRYPIFEKTADISANPIYRLTDMPSLVTTDKFNKNCQIRGVFSQSPACSAIFSQSQREAAQEDESTGMTYLIRIKRSCPWLHSCEISFGLGKE